MKLSLFNFLSLSLGISSAYPVQQGAGNVDCVLKSSSTNQTDPSLLCPPQTSVAASQVSSRNRTARANEWVAPVPYGQSGGLGGTLSFGFSSVLNFLVGIKNGLLSLESSLIQGVVSILLGMLNAKHQLVGAVLGQSPSSIPPIKNTIGTLDPWQTYGGNDGTYFGG